MSDDVRERSEAVDAVALLFAKRRQPAPTMDGAHQPNPAEIKAAQEAVEIVRAALAVAPATDAKYRAVVRAFDALARGDLRALGTVHEDIQGSVDAIVARLRAAPPAPADVGDDDPACTCAPLGKATCVKHAPDDGIQHDMETRCPKCGQDFRLHKGDEVECVCPTPPAPADEKPCPDGDACPDARRYGKIHPAPDAGWEPWGNPYPRHPDVIRTRDLCLAICEKHQAFDAAAEIRVMHLPPAPDAGARIEEAHRALGKPGRMDDDGCCVGCGRSVQPSPCCPDFPVWPGPCRSCYAYDEEQRDAGAAEDHTSEASRDHGAEGSDRAVVEALTALRDRFAALITRNPDFGATDWALVEQADAALRGTPRAKRGGDQPKAGHEAEGREGA